MGDIVAQSIEIDAPIERVWELVMDPERLGDWVTIHRSVSEVPDAELTKRMVAEAQKRGLILLSCGVYANVIRVLVPLVASDALLDEGLDIMAAALVAAQA